MEDETSLMESEIVDIEKTKLLQDSPQQVLIIHSKIVYLFLESMDFTNLSLTQTKRQEMNTQVLVLELESKLEKERVKLAELRKQHYSLAGASEGWEDEVRLRVYFRSEASRDLTPSMWMSPAEGRLNL